MKKKFFFYLFQVLKLLNIRNVEIKGIKTKEIALNYLNKYKKTNRWIYFFIIDKKDKFIELFNEILNCCIAKEIEEKLGNEVHNILSKYLDKKSP